MTSRIDAFKQQGFVNLGSSFLSKVEIDELSEITRGIYEAMPRDHPDYIPGSGVDGALRLPVHNQRIAELIDRIVASPKLQKFLDEILGSNYKIWDISFRRSNPGDTGLELHQDGVGQVNMAICLDDNPLGIGATSVLPSSHLFGSSMKKLQVQTPAYVVNLLSFLFSRLSGQKGDVAFFSNKVWHGRFKNASKTPHDVILMGFFPTGYRYGEPWPSEFLDRISRLRLCGLLGSAAGFDRLIISNCECRESAGAQHSSEHGYSMDIEKPDYLARVPRPLRLTLTVLCLRAIMWFARTFRPVHRLRKLFR